MYTCVIENVQGNVVQLSDVDCTDDVDACRAY